MPKHDELPSRVVTVSATYGAGGSVVAPQLAERLGTLFFDRLIYSAGAVTAPDTAEGLTAEERKRQSPPGRVLSNLSRMATGLVTPTFDPTILEPIDDLHTRVVEGVHAAATEGGVILGRGAAVILAGRPGAFHVRLSGPTDRRLRQGATIEGLSDDAARLHQVEADRAWSKFVERVLSHDPADPTLYHLILDSTVVPLDTCVDVIVAAAEASWRR
jgi:cytidylate kinase